MRIRMVERPLNRQKALMLDTARLWPQLPMPQHWPAVVLYVMHSLHLGSPLPQEQRAVSPLASEHAQCMQDQRRNTTQTASKVRARSLNLQARKSFQHAWPQ